MKTKVISLPAATERQQNILQNFSAKKMEYDLVDGIDVSDIVFSKNTMTNFTFKNKKFEINLENLFKYTNRKWFRFGEIANVLAHYQVWDSLKKDSDNDVYLICEDDCIPSKTFDLAKLNQFDYSKIDCLYLQATTAHMQEKKKLINILPETEWDKKLKTINQYVPFICEGTAAYCITKSGATKLCNYVEKIGFDGPIDNLFARLKDFVLVCPNQIDDYFFLDETANYSYTHTGKFDFEYQIEDFTFYTKKELNLTTT